MQGCTRRSDREAEGARLLSEYAPKGHLGFESLLLRHSDRFSVQRFTGISAILPVSYWLENGSIRIGCCQIVAKNEGATAHAKPWQHF